MKSFRLKQMGQKWVWVVLGGAALALGAATGGGGHRDGESRERDRAIGASASDPSAVNDTMAPIFGTADKPAVDGKTLEKVSPEVGRGILVEFQRAQSSELKALDHRGKLELKELKASQSIRIKEWEKREKDTRHKFFAEHTKGPERRTYVRDSMDRHRTFLQALNEEFNQRTRDQEAHAASVREEQASRLKEFKDSLGRGERPAARLWPSSN